MPIKKPSFTLTEPAEDILYEEKTSDENIDPLPSFPAGANQNGRKTSWAFLRKVFKEKKNGNEFDCDQDDVIDDATDRLGVPPSQERERRVSMISRSPNMTRFIPRSPKPRARRFSSESSENLVHFSVLRNDTATLVKVLQAGGVDIDYMRPPGFTPLHQACSAGNLKMVELLVQHGANIRKQTWTNLSPLLIANIFGHFEIAQYLISQGASSQDIQDGFTYDTKVACSFDR